MFLLFFFFYLFILLFCANVIFASIPCIYIRWVTKISPANFSWKQTKDSREKTSHLIRPSHSIRAERMHGWILNALRSELQHRWAHMPRSVCNIGSPFLSLDNLIPVRADHLVDAARIFRNKRERERDKGGKVSEIIMQSLGKIAIVRISY